MKNFNSKEEVKRELENAGINICVTRTVSHNGFNLVYESYGLFVVNVAPNPDYTKIRKFESEWSNIIMTINN